MKTCLYIASIFINSEIFSGFFCQLISNRLLSVRAVRICS